MTPTELAITAISIAVITTTIARILDVHGACMFGGLLTGSAVFTAWMWFAGYWHHSPAWVLFPLAACLLEGLHIGHLVGWRLTFGEWPP